MTVTEAATRYIEQGRAPIPIPFKSKAPVIKGWQKLRLTLADLPRYFNGHEQNLGVILGEASGGLTDIDLDCTEARALAKEFLPPTGCIFGRKSSPRSHCVYVVNPALKRQPWIDPHSKAMLVELRGTDHQTVFPPSVHPSGEAIEFEKDGEPAVVESEDLTRRVGRLAAASLLVRYWPDGSRHDCVLALAGGLLRGGWREDETTDFVRSIVTVTESETIEKHLAAVRDTAKKLAAGETDLTGWPKLSELLGERVVVKAVREWCGIQADRHTPTTVRLTDVGNGERFAAQHRESVRYCYGLKEWLVWDGRRWRRDSGGLVMTLAKQTARSLDALVAAEPDTDLRKLLRKWATESERKHRLEAALFLAQSEPGMAIALDALDADPWLFNVQNGTLDLRTGALRPHAREDFLTKLAPVDFRPEAVCPFFERLLTRLFEKVPAVSAYIQRILGYSLTGLTTEQCFFILFGVGANGKSTILRAISDLLGEYAATTRPETFLAKRGDEGVRNDVAALVGARFVTSIESEQGKLLAEGLIKGITGDDKISARFLHKEFFSFLPQFKLFIGTNHKPTIKGTDHGIWRRVRCVPFAEVIDEEERDRSYGEKLRGEGSGILNWLVQGCLMWQREGLGEPLEVSAATGDYRKEQDVLGTFLTEWCVLDPTATCTKKQLYGHYKNWCEESGERYPLTKRHFGRALRELGYADAPGHADGKGWRGIGVGF